MEQVMVEKLIDTAIEQLKFSYTPYSNFKVGAALLTKSGKIYTGCNIENASYTPTNCAERTAFFKAVSEGVRDFQAICIVGGKDGKLLGTLAVKPTGLDKTWKTQRCKIAKTVGVHDVYFVFKGGEGNLFNFDWWKFGK